MDKTPKILLVDDEPFNIDYLEQELEDLNYEILSANNGKEALDLIEEKSPDMILLDIMMPVMDGFEVLSKIKAEKAWQNIPVVVISALSDMKSIVKAIELGAEDFLPKPFEPSLLHGRLNAGLEKKRLRDLEQQYLQGLERELEIGRKIQADFLPKEIPQPEGWEIATYFQAAREVSGDFYDVFEISEDKLVLLLGDVVDKGVGAALYMTLFRSLLRAIFSSDMIFDTASNKDKSEQDWTALLKMAVTFTNRYICRIHHSASYATLFFGILDLKTGWLCYIDAGHEAPLILNHGQVKRELRPTAPAVGMIEEIEYEVDETQLEYGDILFLYSDGITDVNNADGEMLGKSKLVSLLKEPEKSSAALVDRIASNANGFMGNAEQYDDITLLAVRRET